MGFFDKIFGDPNKKELDKLEPIVAIINNLEDEYIKFTDDQLRNKTKEFKDRLSNGETLDDILPEAFATVREASKRALGQRHYDVQMMAGIALYQGKITEMKTGEGKTLAATLALYLNALKEEGCHLVTVNDYLARRDAGWMGKIYHFLGISTSAIGHDASFLYDPRADIESETDERLKHFQQVSRKQAYGADITYGTNNEFGFDYLRDNMAVDTSQMAQRKLYFAIVDEVDSILIDEARTPLIISAPAEESASLYARFAQLVPQLKKDEDYQVDEKERSVVLTDNGMKKMQQLLSLDNIYQSKHVKLVHHLEEALKAHALFKKDKDYVIKNGEVVIVDEFTGRLMSGRRYSEGLHQAIEAKEGVEVKRESNTMATISFQNYFRMYQKLAGMTGTAVTEAEEFAKIYNLEVVVIPTNRPLIRKDIEDVIYKTESGKYQAIVEDVRERSKNGQPILIGTISIERNEFLSKLLKRNGIKHNLLNAKQHEREAKIIAQAGRPGAVTLATNMAGRGVDIVLGGEPPKKIQNSKFKIQNSIKQWEELHKKVLDAGGLHVIGTERHESRRIDNQLRGRSGRQGDPGSTQFFVSMEDDLMRIFGGERMKTIMDKLGLPDDQPIKHKMISNSIEQAQKKVEGYNFDIRKHLVDYDDVMNKHREAIYRKRKKILDLDSKKDNWLHEEIKSILSDKEKEKYLQKESAIGLDKLRYVEKMIYLRTIDMLWVEHLNTMTELREGIGLRGYGQRDPLVEYKEESYRLYQNLIGTIEQRVIEFLLKVEVREETSTETPIQSPRANLVLRGADESMTGGAIKQPAVSHPPQATRHKPPATSQSPNGVNVTVRQTQTNETQPAVQVKRSTPKVGRNDPCPCGSGKKYKKCCGK